MTEADYAGLITAAHRYLNAPVIVIWDNLHTHLSRKMRAVTAGHPDWLTVIQLLAYAPDLNPVEGAWSVMKKTWATSPPAPTSSPPRCATNWTASSDDPPSSPGSSARPDSPSTPSHRRPWPFKVCKLGFGVMVSHEVCAQANLRMPGIHS